AFDALGGLVRRIVRLADELRPRVAAVARDVQATAGAAAGHLPRLPPRLPQAGAEDAGVVRGDGHGAGAVGLGLPQDRLPGPAAVGGAVDAALLARAERLAEHRGEGDVRVFGMHDHGADLPLVLPHLLPRLAGVGRFPDAVADLDVAANVGLAAADVHDVGVRRRHGDGAGAGQLDVYRDGLPGVAAVLGLPHAAGGRGGIIDVRIAGHAAGAADAAAGGGADVAELEFLVRRGDAFGL